MSLVVFLLKFGFTPFSFQDPSSGEPKFDKKICCETQGEMKSNSTKTIYWFVLKSKQMDGQGI